jgi:tRNA(Ile)-lysidine synthase
VALSRLGRGVLLTIRRRALLATGDRVAVALSGGPDSVALAWLLRELEAVAAWPLAGLIHVHHGVRGAEADADEAFCRQLADRMRLPIEVRRIDAPALARNLRVSIEAAARLGRYQALDAARLALAATKVATGHTLDDQAETVLLRLLRGAGSRGVSAIRPRLGEIVRPLIDCRRRALRDYLAARGELARDDATNQDISIPRNRLRASVVPSIEAAWPGGIVALARFADLATDDEAWLAGAARSTAAHRSTPDGAVEIDLDVLCGLPVALGRRVIREAIETAGGRPAFKHVEAVYRLARADKTTSRLHLARVTVERLDGRLRLAAPREGQPVGSSVPRVLSVPGEVLLAETGETIRASLTERADMPAHPSLAGQIALLQADAVPVPLAVRFRRPGDRWRPLGAPGTRKLQDWFVDRKVPRAARDRVPLVVDARDRIVWVAGFTIAHECRVTAPAEGVVVLELKGNK